jgi:hypothetical protein
MGGAVGGAGRVADDTRRLLRSEWEDGGDKDDRAEADGT